MSAKGKTFYLTILSNFYEPTYKTGRLFCPIRNAVKPDKIDDVR